MSQIIQELKMKLNQAQTEFHTENQRGALKDSAKIAELEAQMSDLLQQLDVEQRLAENKQVHEQRVEESHAEIYSILDNLIVGDKSIRELFLNLTTEEAEAAYQVVSAIWKKEISAIVEKELLARQEIEKQQIIDKKEKDDLQDKHNSIYNEFTELRKQFSQTKFELEEANAKRDAAANQLQEANSEIKRLLSEVDDLRKERAVGAINAPKVIDVTDAYENYLNEKAKAEAAKPAIYDITPLDAIGKRFSAKLAATDEEITFGYLEKGKYREVTAEEAEVFRTDYEAKRAEEDTTLVTGEEVSVGTPVLQFQESTVDGVVEGDFNGEVAVKTVEERLQALELKVFGRVEVAA